MNGENERWLRKHKKNLGTMVGVFAISALIISSLNTVNLNSTGNVIGSYIGNFNISSIFILAGIVLGIAWFFLREK